jgi:hypothetical protein
MESFWEWVDRWCLGFNCFVPDKPETVMRGSKRNVIFLRCNQKETMKVTQLSYIQQSNRTWIIGGPA